MLATQWPLRSQAWPFDEPLEIAVVMSELTFHKGSIKVQCSSSTRRRSSSRRGRHDTTSSSCRVLPRAMAGTEDDSTSSG